MGGTLYIDLLKPYLLLPRVVRRSKRLISLRDLPFLNCQMFFCVFSLFFSSWCTPILFKMYPKWIPLALCTYIPRIFMNFACHFCLLYLLLSCNQYAAWICSMYKGIDPVNRGETGTEVNISLDLFNSCTIILVFRGAVRVWLGNPRKLLSFQCVTRGSKQKYISVSVNPQMSFCFYWPSCSRYIHAHIGQIM